jgi:hypothetical protein
MPFNKLPLVYQMATEGEGFESNARSGFGSLLRLGVMAPFAYGAHKGFSRLSSNAGASLIGPHTNQLADMAGQVGQNLQRGHKLVEAARAEQGKQFANKLLQGRELQNILSGAVETRNAYLAGLISNLNEGATVAEVRAHLLDALRAPQGELTEETMKIVRSATQTLHDLDRGGDLSKAVSRYGAVSQQLVAPTPFSPKEMSGLMTKVSNFADKAALFKAVPSEALTRTKGLVGWLQQIAGDTPVTFHSIMEGKTANRGHSTFALIHTKQGRIEVGLTHATLGQSKSERQLGVSSPIYRVGEGGATTYTGKMFYLNSREASSLLDQGVSPNRAWLQGELGRMRGGGSNMFGGAISDLPEESLRELERLAGGDLNRNMTSREITKFNQYRRELGTELPLPGRLSQSSSNPAFARHLQAAASTDSATIMMMRMQELSGVEESRLASRLISTPGSVFDSMSSPEIKMMEGDRRVGQIGFGLASSSPIQSIRTLGMLDRVILPVTARIRQMVGRETQYVKGASNNIQGLSNSNLIRMWGQNLEYTNSAMGGINTAYIMDVKGAGGRFGLAEGMSFWGADPNIRSPLRKTISAPSNINAPESKAFRELAARQKQGMGPLKLGSTLATWKELGLNKDYKINSVDDFFKTLGATKGGSVFLGEADAAMIEVPRYTGIKGFSIELVGASRAMGRDRFHLGGFMDFGSEGEKMFSIMAKTTNQRMDKQIWGEVLSRTGMANVLTDVIGLKRKGTLATGGAMLGKGAAYLAHQMISGTALIAPRGAFGGNMQNLYDQITGEVGRLAGRSFATAEAQQSAYLTRMVGAVGRALTGAFQGASPNRELAQQFGLVFGGAVGGAGEKWGFGAAKAKQVIRRTLRGAGGAFAGKGFVEDVIAQAEKGWALGAGTGIAGSSSDIMRQTLGSMEPRTFAFLSHRLQNTLGLSQDQASDFMTSFLARKGAIGSEIKTLQGLSTMVESMAPKGAGISSALAAEKLPTVGMEDFILGASGKTEQTRAFLEKPEFKKGFMLDLGESGTKTGGLSRTLGGGKAVYFAGGEAISSMRGAEIVQEGGAMLKIEPEYVRKVRDFAGGLGTLRSDSFVEARHLTEAQDVLGRAYKEDIASLWGQSWKGLLSGKLEGSAFVQGQGLKLDRRFNAAGELISDVTPGLSSTRIAEIKRMMSRTKGAAIFADAQAFIDKMHGYQRGVRQELANAGIRQAEELSLKDTAERFQRFFSEKGITVITGRDPQLGLTHRSFAEMYRMDTGLGAADPVFQKFVATPKGAKALEKLQGAAAGGKLTSFAQIAAAKAAKGPAGANFSNLRTALFGTMAQNTSSFMGVGKGRMWYPDLDVTVHYTSGHKHILNLSKAAMMYGDFDADPYNTYPLSKSQRKIVGTEGFKRSQISDLVFGIQMEQFTQESKVSAENIAKEMEMLTGKPSPQKFMAEKALQEQYAKQLGMLDIEIGKVRLGIVHSTTSAMEQRQGQRALAALVPLEELVLKFKHAPRAVPVVEDAISAIRGLSRGDTAGFERFWDSYMAKGSTVFREGATPSSINLGFFEGSDTGRIVREEIIRHSQEGLSGVMQAFGRGAAYTAENKVAIQTMAQGMRAAMQDTVATQQTYIRGVRDWQSMQGAIMRGESSSEIMRHASNASTRTGTTIKALDRRLLGPLALGAVGTMMLGSVIGGSGYASDPMIMPGEISDYRVNEAIASGTLRSQSAQSTRPESIRPGPHMNAITRPINIGETYFSQRNSYQIRGESPNMTSLSAVSNFIAGIGGSTSVRINDTRRPLTPNYIDRLTSE